MAKATRKQITDAKRILEDNGYTVLPPEQTEVRTADFEDFWAAYGKKVDKPRCVKLWAKMTPNDKKACLEAVPLYVESTPDVTYRKNPSTYLNNRSWENEIIKPRTEQQQRQQRLNEAAKLVAKYGEEVK